jgi:hypothetical protein
MLAARGNNEGGSEAFDNGGIRTTRACGQEMVIVDVLLSGSVMGDIKGIEN